MAREKVRARACSKVRVSAFLHAGLPRDARCPAAGRAQAKQGRGPAGPAGSCARSRAEEAPLPAWHGRSEGNSQVPEEHRAAAEEAAFPAPGASSVWVALGAVPAGIPRLRVPRRCGRSAIKWRPSRSGGPARRCWRCRKPPRTSWCTCSRTASCAQSTPNA